MNTEKAQDCIKKYFKNVVKNNKKVENGFLFVRSDKYNIDLNLAEGSTNGIPANPEQPYFLGSIGKFFTAVLISILYERGMLSFTDPIDKYLEREIMKDLHVYKGVDYSKEILIKHLLNHTSGLYGYFEGKPKNGNSFLETFISEPTRFLSPRELTAWAKENLDPRFPPGKGYYYSSTGYHLLGLIIENITSMPFADALKEYIFKPLKMQHSYLIRYSEPVEEIKYPIANVYIYDKNVINYETLSSEYAAGGVVSTSEDLYKFMRSIVRHELISRETFDKMKDWAEFSNITLLGKDYGYGIMRINKVPLLIPKCCSNTWGHASLSGVVMFYNEELDTYVTASLHVLGSINKTFSVMLKAFKIISKIKTM